VVVLIERFELHIPQARSLKQKRQVVAPLVAMLRQTFEVSVAEVDHQDLWQRVLQQVERRVDAWGEIDVLDRIRDEWRPED
jgi:uncharacterized protein YlxP (DUF503 family)